LNNHFSLIKKIKNKKRLLIIIEKEKHENQQKHERKKKNQDVPYLERPKNEKWRDKKEREEALKAFKAPARHSISFISLLLTSICPCKMSKAVKPLALLHSVL
jgi:hypothetical protein